jgi:NTE family protein
VLAALAAAPKSGVPALAGVSTTHVGSGKTIVFVQIACGQPPNWGRDRTFAARAATLGLEHALASTAIPFLFPPVSIEGRLYCDGALRQNVPLSPELRRRGAHAA